MQPSIDDDLNESLHLKRLKEGDSSSFEYLFRQYEAKLYHTCLHLTRSPTDAEEVVQEVFVKIWETRHRVNPDLSFSAYLIQIAKNKIYDKAARRVKHFAFQHYYRHSQPTSSNDLQENLNLRSTESVIHQLVDRLPFMQKRVFTLSRFQGLSNEEIADRLQLSKSTVENHIYLASKTLKKRLLNQHLYFFLILVNLL